MGGFGSGRYSRSGVKQTVEECCALDIRKLHRDGSLTRAEFTVTWRGWRGVVGRLSFRRPLLRTQ